MKPGSFVSLVLLTLVVGSLLFVLTSGNNTPAAQAQGGTKKKSQAIPAVTKNMNANYVDGLSASKSPKPNQLIALDGSSKFPESVIPTSIQRRVGGVCAPGSSIRVINTDGTVACEVDDTGAVGGNLTAQTLNVSGGATFQGNHIYLRNTAAPATRQTWGMVVDSASGIFNIGQASADTPPSAASFKNAPFKIAADALNSSVYIAANGKVGIKTNAPSTTLDVNGQALIQGNSLYIQEKNAPVNSKTWGVFVSGSGYMGLGQAATDNPPWDGGHPSLAIFAGAPNYSLKINSDGTTSVKVLRITGGSDLAENFNSTDIGKPEAGTVMVIDELNEGKLKASTIAYDRKVAGIVSGAANVKTGLTLQQDGVLEGDVPVTVVGRVYCKAEAINGAIQPGDLLTTSTIPGYCMKASDTTRANGAIIGKAMTALKTGKGMVLVLVNLQ